MRRTIMVMVTSSVLMAAALGLAWAQTGGGYDLTWQTIDGGGTASAAGGAYTLAGAIGQADAGLQSGGQYSLQGGFWSGAAYLRQVYLPLVARGL